MSGSIRNSFVRFEVISSSDTLRERGGEREREKILSRENA